MTWLLARLRKRGWSGLLGVGCRLVSERIYRREYYFLFQRSLAALNLARETILLAVPITPDNTRRYSGWFPYRSEIFLERLFHGLSGCFYLRPDGVPVAYNWYALGEDYYERAYRWTFRLQKAHAYIFDGYVVPERRGSLVTAQAFAYTLSTLRERGAETVFSVSDKNNPPAWKLHLHLGFEIVGCLELTRVLGRVLRTRQVDPCSQFTPKLLAKMKHHARPGLQARVASAPDALSRGALSTPKTL